MAVFYEMDPSSQSHPEMTSGEMALETGLLTGSQDPSVPSCEEWEEKLVLVCVLFP